jgi:hypothetical protein
MVAKVAYPFVLAVMLAACPAAIAAPGGNGNGNGNSLGKGFGNGNGNNPAGAKGAPLPLAGVTALGQVVTLVGGVLIWRRRRKQARS